MLIGETCDMSNADAVVTANVGVDEKGSRYLAEIVNVEPPDYPARDKAVADINSRLQRGIIGRTQDSAQTFPFCERITVDIIAGGECPSRETIERNAQKEGYKVRSVTMSGRP